MILERRARGPPRGPWSKRAPGGFGVLGRNPPRSPWSKRAPGGFWSIGRGVLQEAHGQKRPLVVLERRARGPPRGPWSKRAPGGFGA